MRVFSSSAGGGEPAGAGAGAAESSLAGGGGAASVSITASIAPTGSIAPTCPPRLLTVPETGAGISTTALSVWTSTMTWSAFTASPAPTRQWTISPSLSPSPTSGRSNR